MELIPSCFGVPLSHITALVRLCQIYHNNDKGKWIGKVYKARLKSITLETKSNYGRLQDVLAF